MSDHSRNFSKFIDSFIQRVLAVVDTPRFRNWAVAAAIAFSVLIVVYSGWLSRSIEADTLVRLSRSHADAITAFRTYYSNVVVPVVQQHSDIAITHDYATQDRAIPIPVTSSLDLVRLIGMENSDLQLSLVSAEPFPWRSTRVLSDFEIDALAYLRVTGGGEYFRADKTASGWVMNYAAPILMRDSCVSCHNNHPDSPRTNWQSGDVRGIQVVTLPFYGGQWFGMNRQHWSFAGMMLAAFLLTVILLIWIHNRSLQAASRARANSDALARAMLALNDRQRALDAHAIVSITDPGGAILEANSKFCDISGYSHSELMGNNHRILKSGVHPEAFYQELWETISRGEVWSGEICNRAKDGKHYWVASTIVPFLDDAGLPKQYIAIRTDITQRKLAEVELEQRRIQAESANRAKSEFLATMSHEIRTPMNGIMGTAALLVDTDLNSEQREYAQLILDSSNSLLRIINDILDLSKLEAGHLEILQEVFSLDLVLSHVESIMTPRVREKGLDLSVEMDAHVSGHYLGDPIRLRQVLLNLVGNAVKFTSKGKVILKVDKTEDDQIRVRVIDTGIGIPKEAQKSLFSMFQQADSSISRRFGGTGLGLAVSRRLVLLMGGAIGFNSEDGEGSEFWFRLPLARASAEESADDAMDPAALESGRNTDITARKILLVEDNLINQLISTRMLERLGHAVTVAGDGREALDCVRKDVFDLIVMDVQMPELDGLSATRLIRAMGGHLAQVPIVAMTANAMVSDREACLAAGMNDFISKPLQGKDLEDTLAKWL